MFKYADLAHEGAGWDYEERLANALARNAERRAIAEVAALEARPVTQRHQQRRLPRAVRALPAHRRPALLHR